MIALLFWLCVLLVVYAYIGYPALITLLARRKPKPTYELPAELPALTVLIAAYNEENVLRSKLDNTLSLDYPAGKLQILVAADGSTDKTPDIVRDYAARGVELSYSPERAGKIAAINRALPAARGEILVFSDANNLYDPQALQELVKPFSDPSIAAVSGAKSIIKGDGALGSSEGLYWRYESYIKKQEDRFGCVTGVAGEILAIRTALFQPAPDTIINDDFYIAMRLIHQGYRVAYAPQARSWERVSLTADDEAARRSRIIAGRWQALAHGRELLPLRQPARVWQILSHKYARPLVPFAMIGAIVFNLLALLSASSSPANLLVLGAPYAQVMLLLQGLFYGMALLGNVLADNGIIGKILYVPTFLVNSNLAALRGSINYIRQNQTNHWVRVQRRDEPMMVEKE